MSLAEKLTLGGLLLDLIGAVLLYFYTWPKKKVGNVILEGSMAMKFDDEKERDVPESEWGPILSTMIDRSRRLTRTGFALLVLGALLQIAGTLA